MMFRRILKGTLALLASALLVFAVPLALVSWGQLGALAKLTNPTNWLVNDGGQVLLGVLTLIAWVCWALLTLSLLAELVANLSRQRLQLRLPGLAFFAPVTSLLAIAIVGLVLPQAVAPALAGSPTGMEAVVGAEPELQQVQKLVTEPQDAPAEGASDIDSIASPMHHQGRTHLVVVGDDLWTLAERYFGDGAKWRLIAAENESVLLGSTDLYPGMLLAIPDSVTPAPGSYLVKPGDYLAKIAAEQLGDAARWQQIYQLNRDLIKDPNLIQIGWLLKLPATASEAPKQANEQSSLTSEQQGSQAEAADSTAPESDQSAQGTQEKPALPKHPGVPIDAGSEARPAPTASSANESTNPQSEAPSASVTPLAVAPAPSEPVAPTTLGQNEPVLQQLDYETELDVAAVSQLVAPLGFALASGLGLAFIKRRRQQSAARALGKRMPVLTGQAAQVESELTKAHQLENPQALEQLNPAVELISDAKPKPTRLEIVVGKIADIEFSWEFNQPAYYLQGDQEEATAFASALASALLVGDSGTQVVLADPALSWLTSLDSPDLVVFDQVAAAWEYLAERFRERSTELTAAMSDDGTAEPAAWSELVAFLPELPDELPDYKVVSITLIKTAISDGEPSFEIGTETARTPDGRAFVPNQIHAPARRVLAEVFEVASAVEYPNAWWWGCGADENADRPVAGQVSQPNSGEGVVELVIQDSIHPVLKLIGPVELLNARGETPARASKQCAEYCAWLLENPGATATEMGAALLVAEGTRRSNMSRLRSWLGQSPEGELYLPDAYSGKITLHPAVTSDWEQLRMLVDCGINNASDEALAAALKLVRGAPMADAAPGQWHWAEQLRQDIIAAVRDIGVVLARRYLVAEDYQQAQWALDQASLAAAGDELLVATEIELASKLDDQTRVQQLVLQLTRRARQLGVDLSDETVALLQRVMEGQVRKRA